MPCPVLAVGATDPISNPMASSEQAPNANEAMNQPGLSGSEKRERERADQHGGDRGQGDHRQLHGEVRGDERSGMGRCRRQPAEDPPLAVSSQGHGEQEDGHGRQPQHDRRRRVHLDETPPVECGVRIGRSGIRHADDHEQHGREHQSEEDRQRLSEKDLELGPCQCGECRHHAPSSSAVARRRPVIATNASSSVV